MFPELLNKKVTKNMSHFITSTHHQAIERAVKGRHDITYFDFNSPPPPIFILLFMLYCLFLNCNKITNNVQVCK